MRKPRPDGGDFVEVFGGDAGGDLVDDGDAGELVAAALEQVHDVSAGDEEAVGVTEFDEPGGQLIAVFHEMFTCPDCSVRILMSVRSSPKRSILSGADSTDPIAVGDEEEGDVIGVSGFLVFAGVADHKREVRLKAMLLDQGGKHLGLAAKGGVRPSRVRAS